MNPHESLGGDRHTCWAPFQADEMGAVVGGGGHWWAVVVQHCLPLPTTAPKPQGRVLLWQHLGKVWGTMGRGGSFTEGLPWGSPRAPVGLLAPPETKIFAAWHCSEIDCRFPWHGRDPKRRKWLPLATIFDFVENGIPFFPVLLQGAGVAPPGHCQPHARRRRELCAHTG